MSKTNDASQKILAELLQQRLSKNSELAAKQARLLAILAGQQAPAEPVEPSTDEVRDE